MNEKVVLCTDSQTFDVKEAGISNSLLLVPDLKLGQATSKSPLKSPTNRANTSIERAPNESTGYKKCFSTIKKNSYLFKSLDSIEDDEECAANAERPSEQRYVTKVFHEYFECREVKPMFLKLGDLLQLTRYSGPENEHYIDTALLFKYQQLLDTTQCSRQEFEAGLKKYRSFEFEGRLRGKLNEIVFHHNVSYRLLLSFSVRSGI